MLSGWMLRLRALFKRTAVEREIDEELRFHFDHQVESYVSARACTRGRRSPGDDSNSAASSRSKKNIVTRSVCASLRGCWRDLRLAVRALRATPVVTVVAILSLALGIGANTAIFSLIDSLVLRTLPVKNPHAPRARDDTMPGVRAWNYPVWEQLRQQPLFEDSAAWSRSLFNLASGGEARFVDGLWASGSFFETLGVSAFMGRTFSRWTTSLRVAPTVGSP